MTDFSHEVIFDVDERRVVIYRRRMGGKRILYTFFPVPESLGVTGKEFDELAHRVGEALLVDSPAARKLMKL